MAELERKTGGPQYISHAIGKALRSAAERQLLARIRSSPVPSHLAIIMDGNRRFARANSLEIAAGHLEGKRKLEELLTWCLEVGLRVLTVYAFSTENLRRPTEEVQELMRLFTEAFREIAVDERVHRHRIRVRAIGNTTLLPPELVAAIHTAEEATAAYDDYRYTVAIGYGGREEIVHAIQELAQEVKDGRLDPAAIDAEAVSKHLYTAGLPDPDLIFRTSGEERISNFLLWQSAYSELYFADVLWPGLTRLDFLRAIDAFQQRRRRFGG